MTVLCFPILMSHCHMAHMLKMYLLNLRGSKLFTEHQDCVFHRLSFLRMLIAFFKIQSQTPCLESLPAPPPKNRSWTVLWEQSYQERLLSALANQKYRRGHTKVSDHKHHRL